MFAEARNDGHLFAVLADGVELVVVRSLQFLAGNVRKLGFGDE